MTANTAFCFHTAHTVYLLIWVHALTFLAWFFFVFYGFGESSSGQKSGVSKDAAAGRKWERPTEHARGESAFQDSVKLHYFETLCYVGFLVV